MINQYHIVSCSFREVALSDLAQFALPAEGLESTLQKLKQSLQLDELMYVNTCNRVMYFFSTQGTVDRSFLDRLTDFTVGGSTKKWKVFDGVAAINHLFKTSASINSLVVGEREILKQIRDTYDWQKSKSLTGEHIKLAIDAAVRCAKACYSKTRIAEKSVSVVSLAVQKLLQKKLPTDSRVLMIGAGQTNHLALKYLKKHGYRNLSIFNRTLSRAESLAEKIEGASAYRLSELPDFSEGFDILISCTGSDDIIINEPLFDQVAHGETTEKVLIDLAVPNDIDPKIYARPNVHRIQIEDLRKLAEENLDFRKSEMVKAEWIVAGQIEQFEQSLHSRKIEKAFSSLPLEVRSVKERALDQVFKKDIDQLDKSAQEILLKVMDYMERKCVNIPMKMAKEAVLEN